MTQEIKEHVECYLVTSPNGSYTYVNLDKVCAMIADWVNKTFCLCFPEENIDISKDDFDRLFYNLSFLNGDYKTRIDSKDMTGMTKSIFIPFKYIESFGYDKLNDQNFVVTKKLGRIVVEKYDQYERVLEHFWK
jgi:hypothetical protein